MKPRNAIKKDLFAADHHRQKIDHLGDPLVEIEKHINFAALAAEVDRVAPRPVSQQGGRPPFPTETMVRILVLKRLYNLSDEQMEYQLLDRMSYQRFCGLGQAVNIPDRTTIWTFENRIGETGARALFDGVSAQLLKQGYIARGGQIIDATLVPAPKQHNSSDEKMLLDQGATPADWKPAKRRQKDQDASWTKKHGKSYFGYKLSVNVDNKYKLIRKFKTDTASTHDSQHFDNVFDTSNTSRDVYADRGYPSEARGAQLAQDRFRNRIQRKGHANKPLSECQQQRNHRIAKVRARVEHVFAMIDQMGGKLVRTIGQPRANFALTMMATCYNLKRLVFLRKAGIVAF
ncbi:IS5/IS1182 family transposase [Chromobacterium sp. ATCC 53434]|uniref:IS5 family transposase n=1 Tax=Chromobacterium sp. (strain ATCC 53434 / SC 14030) TaxID=2059672 RepID=UPI000C77913C|nr:IS5 family transposase [Chromobacterium sp. ATCC 53434]AUH49359.1 IS5/IS1182 family transposase [Chromobacterium sp. ATCC 53434]AUH49381.1 IS5/IS1182 family transposase [Chromobacterium sp. ATCC 53434]AUH49789.1 IS5/IS1182 family transposase [Chromobacterium sp. ATCC 53434]AUH51066.1 IS5/IS1182 family transposase [Chromobacterium sp. ATCC 53434]AUH51246.1 IS5/IS1182 family transposase [Chromobacterium sp. ATCC 53434]